MIQQLLHSLVSKPEIVYSYLFGFAPILVFFIVVWVGRKCRAQTERPPQEKKLLRPPGYTMSRWLDEAWEKLLWQVILSCGLSAMAIALVWDTTSAIRNGVNFSYWVVAVIMATGCASAWLLLKSYPV